MQFVVDTGPLGQLARRIRETETSWSFHVTSLWAVDIVWSELPSSSQVLLSGLIVQKQIPAIGPVADLYTRRYRTRRASTTRDAGEDASIAYCVREATSATFVTEDKDAALVALCELGKGRVISSYDLWAHLRDTVEISADDFNVLCRQSARKLGFPSPPARLGCR